MLRKSLVRQTAVSNNSSTESNNSISTDKYKITTEFRMPSPKPLRKRWNSQDFKFNRQLSSDSLDHLLIASSSPISNNETRLASRRHSVACGSEVQKVSLKAVFNTAMRRMSDACCLLSSAPSSSYNLSPSTQHQTVVKKEGEVVLSHALGTYKQNHQQQSKPTNKEPHRNFLRSRFQNRRFSTDPPPPSYTEATSSWKQPPFPRQKFLIRQQQIVINSKGSRGSADETKREYKV